MKDTSERRLRLVVDDETSTYGYELHFDEDITQQEFIIQLEKMFKILKATIIERI